ncbi:MAG TPA: VanW family protein [Anaerolineae bacterium]|nr:VanW family protein [Anaerolineae bacterium]
MSAATSPSLPRLKPSSTISWLLIFFIAVATFLIVLLSGVVLFEIIFSIRILPGVSVGGIDLGGQTIDQASATIDARLASKFNSTPIDLADADQVFAPTPIDLGLRLDVRATALAAFQTGRNSADAHFEVMFNGVNLAPQIVFDSKIARAYIDQLASKLNRPAIDAGIQLDGVKVIATAARGGRALKIDQTLNALISNARSLKFMRIDLPFEPLVPQIVDATSVAGQLQSALSSNFTLQLENPAPNEASSWDLTPQQIINLLKVERSADGSQLQFTFDADKLKNGLADLAQQINREPEDARFTFNDDTHQLDIIQTAIIGRQINIDTTLQRMTQALIDGQHHIIIALTLAQPEFGDNAKAADLGITQLIASESTFYAGSSAERMTNIAAAAARFHSIIVKPGETFSFDHFLGDVSLDTGYAEALIIANGRTIKGVGGGVCQVSTTAFRAAFTAGFPIIERWPHAYRVGWYERGFGPGLDATVFSPDVDFKFKNDTPYHLLIETYSNNVTGKLTFKFYSTSDGRSVNVSAPVTENVVPHGPDIFEDDPTLAVGTKKQVDYAVDGADVTVKRTVTRNGSIVSEDTVFTRYLPWQAVYKVGTGQ